MKSPIFLSKSASVYLNRSCPRKCPACSVVKPWMDKARLTGEKWVEAFKILNGRGVEFFLLLASEPLLLPEKDLLLLIEFFRDSNIEYGFYTTSPKRLFDKLKDRLVLAGIRNWSSGMDYIPEVYSGLKNSGKLSETCITLMESYGGSQLKSKAEEALRGMRYMFEKKIFEQHILITIYRSNVEFVPEMIRYIVDTFDYPSLHIGLNYVEYGDSDFDFASPQVTADPFLLKESDIEILEEFEIKMRALGRKYWLRIQTPASYIFDFSSVFSQDVPGNPGYCAVGVENDGSLRKCGYRLGDADRIRRWSVFDLADDVSFLEFLKEWEFQVTHCHGCAWSYKPTIDENLYLSLRRRGEFLVDYRSQEWKHRDMKYLLET